MAETLIVMAMAGTLIVATMAKTSPLKTRQSYLILLKILFGAAAFGTRLRIYAPQKRHHQSLFPIQLIGCLCNMPFKDAIEDALK
jgi:hypothetical protein